MVSEEVKRYILEAGTYQKQAEQLGNDPRVDDLCMACEGTLNSINVFVHDEEPWKLINEKNKELNQMFNKEFNKRIQAVKKDRGEYFAFCEKKAIEMDLKRWKCEQKVSFYDYLTKKYDL
jgi:hypothetical protein